MSNCITTGCTHDARGHFCTPCWKRLPWDLKAAITRSSKTGYRRKEQVQKAKTYLEDPINQPKEELHAATGNRD